MVFSPRRFGSVAFVCLALGAAACAGNSTPAGAPPTSTESVDTEPVDTESAVTEPADSEPAVTEPADSDPTTTPTTESAEPATSESPTAALSELGDGYGDYEVGVQTITLADTDGGGRDLTVDVWFPLDQSIDVEAPLHQYIVVAGTYYESPFALSASTEAIAMDGPFPLVVYSHGSGGLRFIHASYTEALASNGYIVAAADHTGNTAFDPPFESPQEAEASAFNRLDDVERVIDAFLNPQSTETAPFVPSIRPDQIAVTGHSFGGFTAYAMASGIATAAGEFVADERVEAIITLAPSVGPQLLTDEQLLSIDIPALVIGGTNDETNPIDPNVTRPWNLTASSPSYRIDLVGAEHQTFTDLCAYKAFFPTLPSADQFIVDTVNGYEDAGCDPEDMPIARAQSITNTFAVALLDEVFKGGAPIDVEQVDGQTDFTYLVAG